ncbi:MAG: cation-translocating P-type ATPase, partial [Euryarchaeota archaeon]|nr:cation-translocating P-type ATPase [Euryarchaeota archaeon]
MSEDSFTLNITGMTCGACVASVEKVASQVEHVELVSVNLPLNRAVIQLQPNAQPQLTITNVITAIERGGFGAKVQRGKPILIDEAKSELRKQGQKVSLALLLALPTLYLTMFADGMGMVNGVDKRLLFAFLATLPVYFWSGWDFHVKAWKSLRGGSANMDVLVHLGTTVAFVWSFLITFEAKIPLLPSVFETANHVFFDGVVFIIGFVLLGNWMEAAAKLKATDAIFSLMEMQPKQARVITDESLGHSEYRNVEAVAVGSLIKVLLGETIPLDGTLHESKASIDVSMMTGEPYPVRKGDGDEVSAGTIVLDGSVLIRTTRPSEDTLLASIISLVEEAQMGKAPIQRLVDRVAGIFVPVVVILALLAALF